VEGAAEVGGAVDDAPGIALGGGCTGTCASAKVAPSNGAMKAAVPKAANEPPRLRFEWHAPREPSSTFGSLAPNQGKNNGAIYYGIICCIDFAGTEHEAERTRASADERK
jgi:hypothetical protein